MTDATRDNHGWTEEQRERQSKRAIEFNARRRARTFGHEALSKVLANLKTFARDDEIEPQT